MTDKAINSALLQRQIRITHSFKLGGHDYECHGLLPLEQVHLARRLAPLVLGALKPESGRAVILQRLSKVAGIGAAKDADPISQAELAEASMELATGILEAASSIDEETVNDIIRKVMKKVWRADETGAKRQVWWDKLDQPTFPDIDGFMTLAIVGQYLVGEFKDRIAEYVASLKLRAGPAFATAMSQTPAAAPADGPTIWENGRRVPVPPDVMAAAGRG